MIDIGNSFRIPYDDTVAELAYKHPEKYILYPLIVADKTAPKSSTRINSIGEGSGGGGHSLKKQSKRQKRGCSKCGRFISGYTLID
jgi:hypothetical protein